MRPETITLLEENIGSKLLNIRLGDDVLYLTSKANEKVNKWSYNKLGNCTAKEAINKMKRQPQGEETVKEFVMDNVHHAIF